MRRIVITGAFGDIRKLVDVSEDVNQHHGLPNCFDVLVDNEYVGCIMKTGDCWQGIELPANTMLTTDDIYILGDMLSQLTP